MSSSGKRWRTRGAVVGSVCLILAGVGGAVASSKSSSGAMARGPAAASKSSAGEVAHTGIFSAYISRGPDRGLGIWGTLSGTITPSGKIKGSLRGDHPRFRVTGLVTDRSAKLVFHLPGGRSLNGVGRSSTTIRDFQSIPTKGAFSGPRKGDRGVWDLVVCKPVSAQRPGSGEPLTLRCVTSEGRVFYTTITQ